MSDSAQPLAPERSLLPRVLEPEVMDTAEEALGYDTMDHAEVNRRFAADFLAALAASGLSGDIEVLDLGTGTAQIPIELCRQNPNLRVRAIDLSAEMLRLAEVNIARAGFVSRIQVQRVDAKRLPFADGQFAAVMSNSIVHHIPQPRSVLTDALRVLQRPGLIFVRDLARPANNEQVRRLVATYAAGSNDQQRQLFDDSLRAALAVGEIRELVAGLGIDPQSVAATSDRHWTWSALVDSAPRA